jgi:imidazolonepropionase-like amidohydrolase
MNRRDLVVVALGIVLGSVPALHGQNAGGAPARLALVGATLIDGTGSPAVADAAVVIEGDRIQAVGRRRDVAIPAGTKLIDVTGKYVLPGFVDLHTHLTMPQFEGWATDNTEATRALRALYYMNRYLRSGITAVRDVASMPEPFQALLRAERAGSLNSIRLFPVGRLITSKGGHGAEMPGMARVASGPWEWRQAVRENFSAGFRQIKLSPMYTSEEIAAAVDEAKTLGIRVTTHAGGVSDTWPQTSMTRIAVEAGTQCIEHLNQMDDDVLDLIAKKGIYVVPTLVVLRSLYQSNTIPPVLLQRGWTVAMHEDLFRKARQRGIIMGIGTDGIGRFTPKYPDLYPGIGQAPEWFFDEMKYFVQLGASPMEAIVAASKNAGLILGEEPRMGTLTVGKWADLQVVRKNPLESLDALGSPEMVMVGGKVHGFEGAGSWE